MSGVAHGFQASCPLVPDVTFGNFPSGIGKSDGSVAYTLGGRTGVDAVELKKGATLWHSAKAVKPLFLFDHELLLAAISDSNSPTIVILESSNGHQTWESESVLAADSAQRTRYLEVESVSVDTCTVTLCNTDGSQRRGGTFVPYELANPPVGFRIVMDVAGSRVEVGDAGARCEIKPQNVLLSSRSNLYSSTPTWTYNGGESAHLELSKCKLHHCITVHRSEKTGRNRHVDVIFIDGEDFIVSVSRDGEYAFIRRINGDGSPYTSTWAVIEAKTASQVGSVPYEAGSRDFSLLRGTVFYVAPSSNKAIDYEELRAIDLRTGLVRWQKSVDAKASRFELRPGATGHDTFPH